MLYYNIRFQFPGLGGDRSGKRAAAGRGVHGEHDIKSSVGAAFYPCCAFGRALGSEGLSGGIGSVGNRRELSTGTCLSKAGQVLIPGH